MISLGLLGTPPAFSLLHCVRRTRTTLNRGSARGGESVTPRHEASRSGAAILHAMCARFTAAAALLTLLASPGYADTYPRQPGIDVIHYVFRLTVNDTSDQIVGETTVTFRVVQRVSELALDLTSAAGDKGMTVESVKVEGQPAAFKHAADRLHIPIPATAAAGQELHATITYRGVPREGLRLIDNIHGERSMFSENWPNRARQWLPTLDHPYDKATGEFVVTAPSHYQVVANGLLMEELDLEGGLRRTHWKQSVPIASWLYALGVARFAVHHYAVVRGVPQQVWVFPQDRDRAYQIFELTGRRAFEFFSDQIGPYAYEKLAHVQAAGLGGGTEHASAIFYGEKGVAAGRAPVVHEVAHQWFGDAVTEKDWDDVWLSEGFATYFTHLYTERFEGRDIFVRNLRNDIQTILTAQKTLPDQPVIHRNLSDMSAVLNRLVYQKGGWVLHMLRGVVGTDRFWDGIRQYYRRYRDTNVSTDDFRQAMEEASGMQLTWFFDQWLERPGMPSVRGSWSYDPAAKQVRIELAQTQDGAPFRLPLEIGIVSPSGQQRIERLELASASGQFTFAADAQPADVRLDPNSWVLMQAEFGRTPARDPSPSRRRVVPAFR
jgi:aminopeptidase N